MTLNPCFERPVDASSRSQVLLVVLLVFRSAAWLMPAPEVERAIP
jgi:hypothetical protein